jgi:small subunit ribosomal protein S3
MDAGALGAEIVLSGKVTGQRSRVEKFNDGYIKHNGEPAETIVDHGQATAVMKLGTIGVDVKIIPPGADLPDDFQVAEDADVGDLAGPSDEGGVEELIAEDADEAAADVAAEAESGTAAETPDEEIVEEPAEDEAADDVEAVEEAIETADESEATADSEESDDEPTDETPSADDLDESVEEQAAAVVAEMEDSEE